MGMYTELILGARLKSETPQSVIDTLKYMCDCDNNNPPADYPFHAHSRMSWMLCCGSYYFGVAHGPAPTLTYDDISRQWTIASRSNLKNYESEIETLLNWLRPHIARGSGTRNFYAIVCYEEQAEPTIYYLDESDFSSPL